MNKKCLQGVDEHAAWRGVALCQPGKVKEGSLKRKEDGGEGESLYSGVRCWFGLTRERERERERVCEGPRQSICFSLNHWTHQKGKRGGSRDLGSRAERVLIITRSLNSQLPTTASKVLERRTLELKRRETFIRFIQKVVLDLETQNRESNFSQSVVYGAK